ncbi:MAG: type IV pilin N-terminal domain-containing protein [Methanospirillaceae archaeon]|nr:type IV pilin N-terminal domain-containing protein [Methanospirillaceae archaeon]
MSQGRHTKDSAVTELVGAILLIGIVVTGLGLVSVLMLSQPPPDTYPQIALSAYCIQCDKTDCCCYEVFIYHDGGEAISGDEFVIEIEGIDCDGDIVRVEKTPLYRYKTAPLTCQQDATLFPQSEAQGDVWSSEMELRAGDTLRIRVELQPVTIRIYYQEGSRRVPLLMSSFTKINQVEDCIGYCPECPSYIPQCEDIICGPPSCPSSNECRAKCSYYNNLSSSVIIPVHKGGKPWNMFTGSEYDLGQPDEFTPGLTEFTTECFSGTIQWKINTLHSPEVKCTCS